MSVKCVNKSTFGISVLPGKKVYFPKKKECSNNCDSCAWGPDYYSAKYLTDEHLAEIIANSDIEEVRDALKFIYRKGILYYSISKLCREIPKVITLMKLEKSRNSKPDPSS